MYSLFSDTRRSYGGAIGVSWFKETGARIAEDVGRVIDYYNTRTFPVKTDHILAKLIRTMNVPLAYDIDRYYEVASARALFVANTMEFTSSINTGRWFEGIFYANCPELIIAYTGMDTPSELAKGWRQLQAVRVLECPISNMAYMLPNGQNHSTETGLAVIAIDLPALMIQYRCFMQQQQMRLDEGGVEHLGIHHFVGKYVLPNMLHSQSDLAIINRLINLQNGAPMGESLKRHVFHISDYTTWLDRGLTEVLHRVSTLKMEYSNILLQIPHVFSDVPLKMPDTAETRQVWWALFITRFKAMQFLIDVAGENGKHYNQALINTLKIDLKRFKSDNVLQKRLPAEMYDDVMYFSKHL